MMAVIEGFHCIEDVMLLYILMYIRISLTTVEEERPAWLPEERSWEPAITIL